MSRELHSPVLRRYAANDAATQHCEWPGCDHEAGHRAPVSRDDLAHYKWFCREHAKQYNKSWNYFLGMTDAEVEADVREDTVWHRPTWPIGGPNRQNGPVFDGTAFHDPFGIFGGGGGHIPPEFEPEPLIEPALRRAIAVLEYDGPLTLAQIKARYKALVKRHHPDANTGGNASDEKIKQINQAYRVVLEFLRPKESRQETFPD